MKNSKEPVNQTNDQIRADELIQKSKRRRQALRHFIKVIKKVDRSVLKILQLCNLLGF